MMRIEYIYTLLITLNSPSADTQYKLTQNDRSVDRVIYHDTYYCTLVLHIRRVKNVCFSIATVL